MKSVATAFVILFGIVSGVANGNVITFSGLVNPNLTPFPGPGTEAGFSVSVIAVSWFEVHSFGNPVPSIFGDSAVGTVEVTSVAPGPFKFSSVDLGDAANRWDCYRYTLTGFLLRGAGFRGQRRPASRTAIRHNREQQRSQPLIRPVGYHDSTEFDKHLQRRKHCGQSRPQPPKPPARRFGFRRHGGLWLAALARVNGSQNNSIKSFRHFSIDPAKQPIGSERLSTSSPCR